MPHHHFTLDDRMVIQVGLELHRSHRNIATELGVSHTAVNAEVKQNSFVLDYVTTTRVNTPRIVSLDLRTRRGKGEVPCKLAVQERWQKRLRRFANAQPTYIAEVAHTVYLERRAMASQNNCKLVDGNELAQLITERLTHGERDSPEQIAGNLRKEGVAICAQTIYNWIRRSHERKQLEKHLRRRGRRYRYTTDTTATWNTTDGKRSIHTRPALIEELTRFGDLEGDTIFGKDTKDRLLTHVDRATGLLSLSLVLGYDSHKIHKQTVGDLHRVFKEGVHTITYDNGSEFAAWRLTEKALSQSAVDGDDVAIYFADPYRSSQRGRNENVNGLVRDFFPKGTDFKTLTKQQVQDVENILNNRSRKRYNWRSPFEQRDHVLGVV